MTAREAAFLSLQKYRGSGKYSNIELSGSIERLGLEGAEKALYTALFYGVIEREITLDYFISRLSERKIDDIDRDVRTILELGIYQLEYMDKIPESAAVNESVKLARRFYARKNSEAFINALLRNFIRERKNISLPKKEDNYIKYLSVQYSLPEWICSLWCDAYGKARAEKAAAGTLCHPTMTLRANTLKISRDGLVQRLTAAGIPCVPCKGVSCGIRLSNHVPLDKLAEFDGLYFVQDEASQIAASALGAKRGETVLDMCACPGGKSFGIAMGMENEGRILAFDLHKNKLSLIERAAEKLGTGIIETGENNASVYREDMPAADRILCDVPCSGLGVIAKKPDIKYKNREDIERLPSLQKKILETSARYLKTGGTLVYSTCTLNPAENKNIVSAFLSENADFELCAFRAGGAECAGMLELIPGETTDGFFIAKMKKVK